MVRFLAAANPIHRGMLFESTLNDPSACFRGPLA
jgi:hypothetical protein